MKFKLAASGFSSSVSSRAATACGSALGTSAAAAVEVEPYGANDAGGFRNVLPAGENGLDNATQLAEFEFNGTYPPHFADQLEDWLGQGYHPLLIDRGAVEGQASATASLLPEGEGQDEGGLDGGGGAHGATPSP